MNETFMEVLVKRKTPAGMKALKIVLTVFAVIFALSFPFIGTIGFVFAAILGGFAYYVGYRSSVEYEYSYLDKELDVDVIYSMQKRKHVATYDLRKLEVLAPANSYHLDSYKNNQVKTKDYSSQKAENQPNVYVMYVGNVKIVFEPTPEMVKAIANIAPRKVFTE